MAKKPRLFIPRRLGGGSIKCVEPTKSLEGVLRLVGQTLDPMPDNEQRRIKRSIAERFNQTTGAAVGEHHVILTKGTSEGLVTAFRLLPTDAYLLAARPYWFGIDTFCEQAGVDIGQVQALSETYLPNPDLLSEGLRQLSGEQGVPIGVYLNNLATPTGRAWNAALTARLGAVLSEHPETIVIEDLSFWLSAFNRVRFRSLIADCPELWRRGNLIAAGSFTKVLPSDGHTLGFVICDEKWRAQIEALIEAHYLAPTTFLLRIGQEALFGDSQATVRDVRTAVKTNLIAVRRTCKKLKIPFACDPDGGTNVFLNLTSLVEAGAKQHGKFDEAAVLSSISRGTHVVLDAGARFHANIPSARINLAGSKPADFSAALAQLEAFQLGSPAH